MLTVLHMGNLRWPRYSMKRLIRSFITQSEPVGAGAVIRQLVGARSSRDGACSFKTPS